MNTYACLANHNHKMIEYRTTITENSIKYVGMLSLDMMKMSSTIAPHPATVIAFNCFNPLSPHDALKHHFTFLKTDLIFQ